MKLSDIFIQNSTSFIFLQQKLQLIASHNSNLIKESFNQI